jgi:hypothetical protein
LMAGLGKPKNKRLGADVAGIVEAVGRNVTQFKAGDAVYGLCHGAFGEYVCTAETKLVKRRTAFRLNTPHPCRSLRSPHYKLYATKEKSNQGNTFS